MKIAKRKLWPFVKTGNYMTTTSGITNNSLFSLLKTNVTARPTSGSGADKDAEMIKELQDKWKNEMQSTPVLDPGFLTSGNLTQASASQDTTTTNQKVASAVNSIMDSMSDASAKTKTDTQIIAQGSVSKDTKDAVGTSVTDKFMAFMSSAKEGPAAFWRAQFLATQGLTEKDVAAMSPEDKAKLEDKIKSFIEQKMEEAKHEPSNKDDKTQDTAKVETGNSEGAKNGLVTNDIQDQVGKGPFSPVDLLKIDTNESRRRDRTDDTA